MNEGRSITVEGTSQSVRAHGTGDVARFLWKHIRSRKGLAFLVLLFGATAEILQSVVAPIWYKKFIDAVTQVSTLSEPGVVLLSILATTIFIRFIAMVCGDLKFRLNTRFQPKIMHEMMVEAFEKTLRLSHRFFADHFTGSLIRKIGRIGGNFEQLMDIFMIDIWGILLSICGIMIVLAPRFPMIAILIFFWIVLTVIAKTFYIRYRIPYFAEYSKLDAVSVGIMSDTFSNVSTVQSFGRTKKEVDDFIVADKKATGQMIRNWTAHANIDVVSFLLNILLEAAALGGMISLLIAGQASVGDVVLVQSFLLVVFGKLNHIARLIRRSTEASTQIEEVLDVIEQVPEIRDLPRAKPLRVTKGEVTFSDVSFKYQENGIFQNLSLQIVPKERVGFVGPSGAGKTTMTKLLLRFFEVQDGDILIDNQSVKKVTQESLRQSIAYVPQEPVLFHRSLRENISYGKSNASMGEIMEAAKKAHCHEFIAALPHGYESLVGERGVKLSGGERQRVAIARAILKNAPILVLDEATSSLDSESEALIQDALRELMKEKTVIVIAHRLSTIMQMDRIIVMDQGKVVDTGTHDQLLKKVGTYQKLWNIQVGGFQNV